MAEFQEVMRQWVRARKATASNADGENVLSVYPLEAYDDDLIASIEKGVMKWAAEHPEPVYPTWVEWLRREGIIPEENNGMLATLHDQDTKKIVAARIDITPSALQPIPADIAEKLGLQPKEG